MTLLSWVMGKFRGFVAAVAGVFVLSCLGRAIVVNSAISLRPLPDHVIIEFA